MDIHEKAVRKMIAESPRILEVSPHIEPTLVRLCEICGGSTESISNHICKSCAMQIRKLLRENREVNNEQD